MKRIATGVITGLLVVGAGVATTAPAQADAVAAHNLVNVQIDNVLNNNDVAVPVSVTVPINAAANICGVSVAVLAEGLVGGPVSCDSRPNQNVTVTNLISQ